MGKVFPRYVQQYSYSMVGSFVSSPAVCVQDGAVCPVHMYRQGERKSGETR